MRHAWYASLLLLACGGRAELAAEASTPAVRHDGVAAELDVVARYAEYLRAECSEQPLELERAAIAAQRIATQPPIAHVGWRLEVCRHDLVFHLDCSRRGDRGTLCRPHGWPPIVRYPDHVPLARELEAVIALAERDGPCGEPWCPATSCLEPALRVRWRPDRYDVERCGIAREVRVVCRDSTSPCSAQFDPPR